MALSRMAALLIAAAPFLLAADRGVAAPVPHAALAATEPGLVAPACHRGWHHRSGRPCGYGYGYRPGPPAYGYRYGVAPYGYGRRVCRWRTDEWGRAVRVCFWR